MSAMGSTDEASEPAEDAVTSAKLAERFGPLDWTKPGPGTWLLDSSHFEADCSRLAQMAMQTGMTDGMADGFARMGGPIKGLEARFVNGHFYYRMVPLIGGDKDLPLPPSPVLWLVTRLHPEFRRQNRLAARSMEGRLWNEELEEWNETLKPDMLRRSQALASEDPSAMDNEQLADHLRMLIDLVVHGARLHFRLHISDLGPIGLLLVRAREWNLDNIEVMQTLAGYSPATSAPAKALSAIKQAAGSERFATLDEVRAASTKASDLLDAFLLEYGWRLTTGYDLQELTLAELPELILIGINGATDPAPEDEAEDSARQLGNATFERLKATIDPADHEEFERLVSDARALYGLRDENGPITYQWPAGLLRRGLLEASRRLLESGRIGVEQHVFDLEADELDGLLRGAEFPTVETLETRLAERQYWKSQAAPAILGKEQEDPPPWTLPAALAKVMDAVTTVIDLIESDGTVPTLDGAGIGADPYVGRACVVSDEIDALSRMEPGDVLIAPFTVPTYNAVLATAGAVVVENGGLLCHAAVIAREYGIPGLVGVTGATDQITDGALVRVDPANGTIRELAAD